MTQCVYVVEITEHERGWGQRPEGFYLFLNKEDAANYITEETKDRNGPAPDEYFSYQMIGYHPTGPETYAGLIQGEPRWVKDYRSLA